MRRFWWVLVLIGLVLHGSPLPWWQSNWGQGNWGQAEAAAFDLRLLEVRSQFPQGVTVYSRVQSDLPLANATFYLTMDGGSIFTQPVSFSPARDGEGLLLQSTWDGTISSGEAAPPFAQLQFWWQLVDSAGNSHYTDSFYTLYSDQRRPWQQTEGQHVQLYSYLQAPALLDFAVQEADAAVEALAEVYGYTLTVPPVLVFYNSAEDGAIDLGAGVWEPFGDAVVGRAYPETNAVILLGLPEQQQLARVIWHEIAHLYQFHTGGMFFNAWHWWIEGDAAAQEPAWSREEMLGKVQTYAQTEQLPYLPTWDFQPQNASDHQYMTAIGASFVIFLLEQYGPAYHAGFYQNWHSSKDFYQAFRLTYGQSLAQLDQQWRAWIGGLLEIVREP